MEGPTVDKDLLISRVVDGEASVEDWSVFRAMAERDPELWRELAETQGQHAELSAALAEAIAIADGVDAPVREYMAGRFNDRLRLLGAVGGWAAAAAVALAWVAGVQTNFGGRGGGAHPQDAESSRASLMPGGLTYRDAYRTYLDKGQESGRVVGEMPGKVLLDAQPAPDGKGFVVLYVRQIVERAVVDDLYQVGTDERGQPVPVRVTPASLGADEPM